MIHYCWTEDIRKHFVKRYAIKDIYKRIVGPEKINDTIKLVKILRM